MKKEEYRKKAEDLLTHRGVMPTANRLLVLQALQEADCALAMNELEERLDTVDKSSIFRTLTLFLAHNVVHKLEDGSGKTKYALCCEDCHCGATDGTGIPYLHPHFYCEVCHRTFCLREHHLPTLTLPEGYTLHSAVYVLKGICPHCQKQNKRP